MQDNISTKSKIIMGLALVYEKLLKNKRLLNQEIVVIRDNKIVKIKP